MITYVSIRILSPFQNRLSGQASKRGALAMRRKLVVCTSDDPEFTASELDRLHIEHRVSSQARLRLGSDDMARMVAEFAESRGITQCKPAYAALSPQYRV